MEKHLLGGVTKYFKMQYQPLGFSWMLFADRNDFDKAHYDFRYARREFLGDVRTLVFDITPKKGTGNGRFLGRIWVEDQDFNIVRLNGTYAPRPRNAYFFHMRQQTSLEQVKPRVDERSLANAVVAGLVMLYPVMPYLIAQGEQEVVVSIVTRVKEDSSFRHEVLVCSYVLLRDRETRVAFSNHIDHVLRILGRGERKLTKVTACDQRRIYERGQGDCTKFHPRTVLMRNL